MPADRGLFYARLCAEGEVAKNGRPTKYKTEYDDMAMRHCLLGADNAELAALFKVSITTIEKWIRDIPSFSRSVYEGREGADAHVAQALYHRAKGYEHPETKVFMHGGDLLEANVTRHHPPDTAAASLWLRNRKSKFWRDKQDVEVSGKLDLAEVLEQAHARARSGGDSADG